MSIRTDVNVIDLVSRKFYRGLNNEYTDLLNQQRRIAPETTPIPNKIEVWPIPSEIAEILHKRMKKDDIPSISNGASLALKIVLLDYLDNHTEADIVQMLDRTEMLLLKELQSSKWSFRKTKNSNKKATFAAVPTYNPNQIDIGGFTEKGIEHFKSVLKDSRTSENFKKMLENFPEDFNKEYVGVFKLTEKTLRMYLAHEITHVYSGEMGSNYERYIEEAFANYIHHFIGQNNIKSNQDIQNLSCESYIIQIPPSRLNSYNSQGFGNRNIAKEISWMAIIIAQTANYKCQKNENFNLVDWSRKELKAARKENILSDDEEFLKELIPNEIFGEMQEISEFYDKTLYDALEELGLIYRQFKKNIDSDLKKDIESDFKKNFNTPQEIFKEMKENHHTINWLVDRLNEEEKIIEKDAKELENILQDLERLKRYLEDESTTHLGIRDASDILEIIEDIETKIQKEEKLAKKIQREHNINSKMLK